MHIDDITILGSDLQAVNRVKDDLQKHFMIMDLGEAKQVVGLELEWDHANGTIKIFQSQYIKKDSGAIWNGELTSSHHSTRPQHKTNQDTR